ncbi:MFS transporter [Terrabacter aerolatus]|uniref:MFS transporter n=1 Tax=Terrabacter aerolatus TaxID=422442 RepID=A0A512CXY5_9MICO|nr:MFS transporter [Terrabacter aerolatus]GEO29086.1 MFS transporter [Terrabacter aerolatus]
MSAEPDTATASAGPLAHPTLVGESPPRLGRDRMVQAWVATMAVSWFGDAVWTVALAWTAVHTLSPAMAGLVLGAEMLPQAVFVLVGGVIADRWDTRRILVTGRLVQGLVLVGGALAWSAGVRGAPLLLSMGVVLGTATGLTLPASATLSRQLVRSSDLATVSGWSQIGGRLARLLGAPAGGMAVAVAGPSGAMLANAVTFVAVAAVLTFVVRPRYRMPRTPHSSWVSSLRDGAAYLRRDESARLLVLGLAALNVFVSPVIALGVALRVSGSGWGPAWLGAAEAAFATGAIAGSVLAIRWRVARPAQAGFTVLVGQGLCLAATGIGSRVTLIAAMALVGVAAGSASVWLSGTYQRTVAPSHLGRVSSVSSLGDMALVPLAIPAFGALAAGSSVLAAACVYGAAMAALCLWFATRPGIARLR